MVRFFKFRPSVTLLLLIGLVVMLSGCAARRIKNYEAILATYVGKDSQALIMDWGVPVQTHDMPNGGKGYVFVKSQGHQMSFNAWGGSSNEIYCKTTFFTDSLGTVQTWRWDGNACKSKHGPK